MSSDATRHTIGKPPSGSGSERMTSRRRAMAPTQERLRIAVEHDEEHVALSLTDRSVGYAGDRRRIDDHLAESNAVVALVSLFEKSGQGRREMLPSNLRFQRLSQAALSRSQFLRLAAGALVPFLPLSAAAAKNPELAQNDGAPETEDESASDRMGPSS